MLPILALVLALLTLWFTWENDRRIEILRQRINHQISQDDTAGDVK